MEFADHLRSATAALHRNAERSGVIGALLRGDASCAAYTMLLRNLLPAYRVLEDALQAHASQPVLGALARPEVFRTRALESDLRALEGSDFEHTMPLLEAGERYAARIDAIARREPLRLVGHAYTRYLGDLNGGQVLARVLRRKLGLTSRTLSFYRFPAIGTATAFKRDYRLAIDRAGHEEAARESIVNEACLAFGYNIEVSEASLAAAVTADIGRSASPGGIG